jgi:hypothetical protein
MITEELCELLVQQFNGWNYDGTHGVLRHLHTANTVLASQDCNMMLVLDETTGTLPLLATTNGVFSYNMVTTIRKVSDILVSIDDSVLYDYTETVRRAQRNSIVVGGMMFARWPYVMKPQEYQSANVPAKVVFSENPGTTTDRFYLYAFKRPRNILSMNIQPDIVSPWDAEYLLPAAAKLIEGVQSGNYIEAYQFVQKELKPKMANAMNKDMDGDSDDLPVSRDF